MKISVVHMLKSRILQVAFLTELYLCFLLFVGTRATMQEYETCNLGKVKANAIVARGGNGYNETELNAFINLFIYAQQFYGRKDQDDFR
jgi:hypothetical protein